MQHEIVYVKLVYMERGNLTFSLDRLVCFGKYEFENL